MSDRHGGSDGLSAGPVVTRCIMPTQVMPADKEVLRQSKVHSQQWQAKAEQRCSGFKMHEMQRGAR